MTNFSLTASNGDQFTIHDNESITVVICSDSLIDVSKIEYSDTWNGDNCTIYFGDTSDYGVDGHIVAILSNLQLFLSVYPELVDKFLSMNIG